MIFKDINNRVKKQSFSNPTFFNTVQYYGTGQAIWNRLQTDEALIKAFKMTPEVYAVVTYMCSAISKVKYKLYEGTKDDKGKQITDHEILDLLRRPNKLQSWYEFIQQFYAYYYVIGNAYMDAFEPVGFKPTSLFILPSQYMCVFPESSSKKEPDYNKDFRVNNIAKYVMKYGVYSLDIDARNVLHKKTINLGFKDGQYLFGMSPLVSGEKPITSLQVNYEAKVATIQNRGAMGILAAKSAEFPMPEKQKKEVQEEYKQYGLSEDKYSVLITNSPLEYTRMGMDIKELQLNENNLTDYRATCKILNFPSVILGDPESSTYNNVKEAKASLWEDNLIPQVDDFYEDLTNFLSRFWTDRPMVLLPDYSNIQAIQKDMKKLNDALKLQLDRGVITPNEYRMQLGMDVSADKNLNKYYILKSLIPIENAGKTL